LAHIPVFDKGQTLPARFGGAHYSRGRGKQPESHREVGYVFALYAFPIDS